MLWHTHFIWNDPNVNVHESGSKTVTIIYQVIKASHVKHSHANCQQLLTQMWKSLTVLNFRLLKFNHSTTVRQDNENGSQRFFRHTAVISVLFKRSKNRHNWNA